MIYVLISRPNGNTTVHTLCQVPRVGDTLHFSKEECIVTQVIWDMSSSDCVSLHTKPKEAV